jgi:C1A family cysteine protease
MTSGLVTEDCFPYVSGSGYVPPCPTTCKSGSWVKYKCKSGSITNNGGNREAMKTDLSTNGPFENGFAVYQDFLTYKSGVYYHQTGGFLGYHATMHLGWGNANNMDYWIVQNSWGTVWGQKGFFWIKMGDCQIDQYALACTPA